MDLSRKILSDIIVHMKYAKYLPKEKRRETWEEIVDRCKNMHIKKFPKLKNEIEEAFALVYEKKILPSMRSLQFGGKAVEANNSRLYNCSALAISSPDAFREHAFLLLSGCGVGYALDLNTKIPTPNGWSTMGELKTGDMVFGADGKPTKIINSSSIYKNHDVYKITFSNGATIKADGDHLWEVQTISQRDIGKYKSELNTSIKKTIDLKKGYSIGVTKPLNMEDKNLSLDPYALGFWLGDDNSNAPMISTKDEFIIKEYAKIGFRTTKIKNKKYDYYVKDSFGLKLRGLGLYIRCTDKKSKRRVAIGKKFIPKEYLRASYNQRLSLLQGLMDSDGTISKKGQCVFCIKDAKLCSEVFELCASLGLNPTYHSRFMKPSTKEHLMYVISMTTQEPIFRLSRKLKRLCPHTIQADRIFVKSIRKIKSIPVKCISVNNADKLYLAGETFIPTHNSVQLHHIKQLPKVIKNGVKKKNYKVVIQDSIEGWSDAVDELVRYYFGLRKSYPDFHFFNIRDKGERLKTSGGIAPGAQPLKDCLHNIEKVFTKRLGEQLTSVDVNDICCHIADMVMVGGSRRSSSICLFSYSDNLMTEAKYGEWYIDNPQRGRANNSVVLLRQKITEEDFNDFFEKMRISGSGDPGFMFSNNSEILTNPCVAEGSLVNTPTGLVPVENIKKGDLVKTILGSESVKNIETHKNLPVMQIEFSNFVTSVVTPAHIYHVMNDKHKLELCRVRDLNIGDKVRLFPATLDDIVISEEEYNKFLLTGILLGDGCYTKKSLIHKDYIKICTNKNSKQYNENIKKLVVSLNFTVLKDNKSKIDNGMSINISSAKNILTYLDLDMLCSYEKNIDVLKITNLQQAIAILEGLLVTDGNINTKTKRPEIRFSTSSKELAKNIVQLLLMCGCKSSITTTNKSETGGGIINGRQISREYDINVVHLAGDSACDFAKLIVDHCMHPSKKKRLEELINRETGCKSQWWTIVKSITHIGNKNVYDLFCEKSDTWITEGLVQAGCGEISLRTHTPNGSGQMCNLVEINAHNIKNQKDFNNRARMAARIATLQASYTDFHYIRETWKEITEMEALIGVGMTGIASNSVEGLNLTEAGKIVLEENENIAQQIGINKGARCTTIKPSGTSSLVLGTSSGIHSWYAPYYIRRITVEKDEPIYLYLKSKLPDILEDNILKPTTQAYICVPIKAPDNASFQGTALQLLSRVKKFYKEWVLSGHRTGDNTNNISCTVEIKDGEWERVGRWLWENRESYSAISVFPYLKSTHPQLIFEEITKEVYEEKLKSLKQIDLTKVIEEKDNTKLQQEVACAGGACEIV